MHCTLHAIVLVTAVAVGLVGCGPAAPTSTLEETVPAGGLLTYRGQPLEYYRVTFFPDGHRPAAGTTTSDGRFVLGTNREGDGAVVGTHRVAVVYVGPPNTNPDAGMNDFSPPPPPKVKIPAHYHKAEKSGLAVEIPAGGNTELEIALQ